MEKQLLNILEYYKKSAEEGGLVKYRTKTAGLFMEAFKRLNNKEQLEVTKELLAMRNNPQIDLWLEECYPKIIEAAGMEELLEHPKKGVAEPLVKTGGRTKKINRHTQLGLLEDIGNEENPGEVVVVEADKDPASKIARILETERPDFSFDELEGGDFPSMSLAYYFSKGLNPLIVNRIIAQLQEGAFLGAMYRSDRQEQQDDSLIERLDIKTPSLPLKSLINRKKMCIWKKEKPRESALLQYPDIDVTAFLAAQRLIEIFPLVASRVEKINTASDVVDIILYSQLILNTEDVTLQNKLKELANNKEKSAEELLDSGFETISSGCKAYNSLLEIIKGDKIDKEQVNHTLEELFGQLKSYEQAVCLAELVGDFGIVKRIFQKNEIYKEFEKDKEELEKSKPNLVNLWKSIITEYYKQLGFEAIPEAYSHLLDYTKLNYEGYKRVCTEFMLGDLGDDKETEIGDEVEVVNNNYGITRIGSRGFVTKKDGKGICVNFHCLPSSHKTSQEYMINIKDVKVIKPKHLKEDKIGIFEKIKESAEQTANLKYFSREPIMHLIEKKLELIFTEEKAAKEKDTTNFFKKLVLLLQQKII